MDEQAAAYQELAGLFEQLAEGEEVESAGEKMGELVAQLVKLKEEASTLERPEGDEAVAALQNNKAYSEAVTAYFAAQNKYLESEYASAEVLAALQGFHKAPEPQEGEGRK